MVMTQPIIPLKVLNQESSLPMSRAEFSMIDLSSMIRSARMETG